MVAALLSAETSQLPVEAVRALSFPSSVRPKAEATLRQCQVLPKYADDLTPSSYYSIVVALSRKERWDLAEATMRWARGPGNADLRSPALVGLAGRRLEEGHVDRALQARPLLLTLRHEGLACASAEAAAPSRRRWHG